MDFLSEPFYDLRDSLLGRWMKRGGGFFGRPSYLWGQRGAVYVDVDKPGELFYEDPQINLVVNRKAQMWSNMEIVYKRKDTGERVDMPPELYDLLQNPNTVYSQNQFLKQFKIQEQVYGNQFMYRNKLRLKEFPKALWNVSPLYMKPYMSGLVYDQTELNKIIEYYQFNDMKTQQRRFETDEIMWTRIPGLDDPIMGVSPMRSLKYPASNTKLAYQYRNVIMGEKGAIGILSNKSNKDSMGSVPLTPKEKERIEKEYVNRRGIRTEDGQRPVILTDASLEWTPMSYPTKELLLIEEVDENFKTKIDAYGLNSNIFSSKAATYENVKNSIILCYQDTIIPEAELFLQSLTQFLNVQQDHYLCPSYEHIPILAGDEKSKAETTKAKIDYIVVMLDKGIIDAPIAALMIQEQTGLEIQTPDQMKSFKQAWALRAKS